MPAVRSAFAREIGWGIEYHASIASTQSRARALADAGESGIVVVADLQTAGQGTKGRVWHAPAGTSLLASWVFRPVPADPALFSQLAGLAVARACASLGRPGGHLKWPNDVQFEGRKVAGTLAQASTGPDGGVLVLGIGINVHQRAEDFPGELRATAISVALAGRSVDRLALLARVSAQLDRVAGDPGERARALAEVRQRSTLLGRLVEVAIASRDPFRGTASRIDDDGALVVETASGEERILAGEVTLVS